MLISDLEYLVTMEDTNSLVEGGARPRRQSSASAFGTVNSSAIGRKSTQTDGVVLVYAQADEFGAFSSSAVSGSATAKG